MWLEVRSLDHEGIKLIFFNLGSDKKVTIKTKRHVTSNHLPQTGNPIENKMYSLTGKL